MMGGRSLRGAGNSAESTLGRKPAIFLQIRAARPPANRGPPGGGGATEFLSEAGDLQRPR